MNDETINEKVLEIRSMITEIGYDAKHSGDKEIKKYAQKTINYVYDILSGSKII